MEERKISYEYFTRTMGFMRMKAVILRRDRSNISESDRGLKEKLFDEGAYDELLSAIDRLTHYPYSMTQYTDELGVSTILINGGDHRTMAMTDEDESICMVGPFVEDENFGVGLHRYFEDLGYPETVYPVLKQYVETIPYYSPMTLPDIIRSIVEDGVGRSFVFNPVGDTKNEVLKMYSKADSFEVSDESYDLITERYEVENEMLSYVKLGDAEKALEVYRKFTKLGVKQKRTDNFLQNSRNYLIVFNTLLRKAVEEAGVHPIYIDYYSSSYAVAINHALTNAAIINMGFDMLEKYTTLVHEKARGHLSPVIKDIVLYIDFHQKDDLSLSFFSEYFNVSKNYLSNLFHKEMGMPLTEYVRDFRMKRAGRLLLNSSMTLSDIASAVGYENPNYFIRHFKQVYAITPKQYQKEKGARK